MSGVAVVRYLLANNSGLTAVVPAARIMAGVLPVKTTMPAIAITQISGVQRNTVAMTETKRYVTERIQVTAFATTYATQKSIMNLIRAALPNTHATVNSIDCDSLLPDLEGPDVFDADSVIYEQSQDFVVRFAR